MHARFSRFLLATAQGRLEDYQRAERFLPGNVRHLVYVADVNPHWIEKTNRFWYRKVGLQKTEFVLVDAEQNTSGPAFDHERLAAALSRAAKQDYTASALPFSEIEFLDGGKAIRFSVGEAQWSCVLATYECHREQPATKPDEVASPNKRWAAYVKEHNLYLRDIVTGTVLQLTHDGVAGWDYATPLPSLRVMVDQGTEDVKQPAAVFWSPDSSKLITYRIDSRNSGPLHQPAIRSSRPTPAAGIHLCLSIAGRDTGEGRADHLRHPVGQADRRASA